MEALQVFEDKKAVEFLISTGVMTEAEIHSRHHIYVERYNKTLEIELRTLAEMVQSMVVPAIEKQMALSSQALASIKSDAAKKVQTDRVARLEKTYADMLTLLDKLDGALEKMLAETDEVARMKNIASTLTPIGNKLRDASDLAETLVSDSLWPLPKYREMLFANTIS